MNELLFFQKPFKILTKDFLAFPSVHISLEWKDGEWAGKDENGEAVEYKGTSAVKGAINPQRLTSLFTERFQRKSSSKGRSQCVKEPV